MSDFRKRHAKYEKRYQKRFLEVLRSNNRAFVKGLDFNNAQTHADRTIIPTSFRAAMLSLYKEAAIPQAKTAYNETKRKAFKFTGIGRDELWLSNVIHYLETNGLDMLTQSIADTQKKILLKIIQQGIDEGKSYEQILNEIETNDVWVANAMRIARTESTRAMNYGHMVGAAALTFQTDKVWLAAQDARTRGRHPKDKADHYHMNEQRVGYDAPFTDPLSGAKLLFPGDPSAPAKDTVNCRCRVIFEPKRQGGRIIPKQPSLPSLTLNPFL